MSPMQSRFSGAFPVHDALPNDSAALRLRVCRPGDSFSGAIGMSFWNR
jgi:hypothetical protein